MSARAQLYVGVVICLGVLTLLAQMAKWTCADPVRLGVYFLIAVFCSTAKMALPGVPVSFSLFNIMILAGVLSLSPGETLAMGLSATLVHFCWRNRNPPELVQLLFNLAVVSMSIAGGYLAVAVAGRLPLAVALVLRPVLAATAYFLIHSVTIAGAMALASGKRTLAVWRDAWLWTFPSHLAGGLIAGAMDYFGRSFGWGVGILVPPAVYGACHLYRLLLKRMERERVHAEEMARLHLRTIEALALAIEAKDDTTHQHLRRVQVYAEEIGKELRLSELELKALQAASLLHDIGKLAVPDYIISKPGKLTVEEFEKMKIHPVVGAEILERVQFPYPVVPIVRHHHEKWDGTGYPDGLCGKLIPIGARILSAVDCLDALASDRQYRRALPLEKALEIVFEESGKSFDPAVVEILTRRAVELEQLARSETGTDSPPKLSIDVKVERGEEPAAGFESTAEPAAEAPDFLVRIARARQEVVGLQELIRELGNSLSLQETIALFDARIKPLIPHDGMAIYIRRGGVLHPAFVVGESNHLFGSLEIPIGQGLSGWVVENRKAIVNGNPSVESGYLNDPSKITRLRSALAVPLEGVKGEVTGVIALYHLGKDAFSKDHLRILTALSPKITAAIHNALKYHQANQNTTIDPLTGLPNARSLFVHLDAELSRCRRTDAELTVLVCDLENFDRIHARFGHVTGDHVLKRVAGKIKESLREYDCVARMGGTEFVIVLPEFPKTAVPQKIEQITALIIAAATEGCEEESLEVRAGYAHHPEDGSDADELLAQADRRMNTSKRAALTSTSLDLAQRIA